MTNLAMGLAVYAAMRRGELVYAETRRTVYVAW